MFAKYSPMLATRRRTSRRPDLLAAIATALILGLLAVPCLALAAGGDGTGPNGRGPEGRNDVAADPHVVRTAVIGGMTMTGLWPAITKLFEEQTGYKVVVVATGVRTVLSKALSNGRVDLLTMHSGDITTNLVADGWGILMRPWTRNDLVIVGPASDPAGIAGMKSGAEALAQIAARQANFIDVQDMGGREVAHNLWKSAGVMPRGEWYLQDGCEDHLSISEYASARNAYFIAGRIPLLAGKKPLGKLKIMVDQDPAMMRPYIVMEANSAKCPGVNSKGARALSDFLLGPEAQAFLDVFGKDEFAGICPFHPVYIGDGQ